MTAKEVYQGGLKPGDSVRVIATGRVYVVDDIVAASVDGTRINVLVSPDLWYDVSEVEKV